MAELARLLGATIDRAIVGAKDRDRLTRTDTRTLPLPSTLAIDARNGAVTVRGADREDVRVTITKRARTEAGLASARVVTTGDESDPLEIAVEHGGDVGGAETATVDLDVRVPTAVPVERIATQNGRITVQGVTGDARLETRNGRVMAEGVDGRLDLRTTNGSIEARDVASVERASTTNGTVDLELDAVRDGTVVEATNGTVDIRVGPSLDADVTLSTNVGSIDAPPIDGRVTGVGVNRVRGSLGEGGPALRVETRIGSISLVRLDD